MSLIQVREKAQITIPSKIRKALDIKEGDYLEAEVEDNKIVFIPKVLIDKTEPVTLSKKGEEMLKEALGDVKKGRVKKFKNVEELIDDLHKETKLLEEVTQNGQKPARCSVSKEVGCARRKK